MKDGDCEWCGGPLVDHRPDEQVYCSKQLAAYAKLRAAY